MIMKDTLTSKDQPDEVADDMMPEYRFNYDKARPNRFAEQMGKDSVVVVLEPDVAQVFKTPESVNEVLRALIATMPSALAE
jgi:hypothetical protein